MDAKLRDRLVERLYPTATFVFLLVTAVVWTGIHFHVVPQEITMTLLNGWFTYLGAFAGYMFGHEPEKEALQGQGMSEAATHKLLDIVREGMKR